MVAYDSYEDEYHLTPRGWDPATERPPDAVETWALSVRQVSGWSKNEWLSWEKTWADPKAEADIIDDLHQRHPPPIKAQPPDRRTRLLRSLFE
jgi:hypothetical protein